MTASYESALWISESEVVSMMDMDSLGRPGAGDRTIWPRRAVDAQNMVKTHGRVG